MDDAASLIGRIVFGDPAAYDGAQLPTLIYQLREAQTYLEHRYAEMRKAASERQAARQAPEPARQVMAQRKRGRKPRAATNGATPPADPPSPPLFTEGATDGQAQAGE